MASWLPDYITNPKCGLDIYETESAETWSACAESQSKVAAIVGPMIILIIMLIAVYATDGIFYRFLIILGSLLLIAALIYNVQVSGYFAGIEYERFNNELNSYIKNGLSRADAIKEVKRERETLAAARMQARATVQQGSMIAAAISSVASQRGR